MAHVQKPYSGLWRPENLAVDKISSQKMFIDNIETLEIMMTNILKIITTPVADITALKAINTSNTVLYSNGKLMNVLSSGIYSFTRDENTIADNINYVTPTVGGGRWILRNIDPSIYLGVKTGTTATAILIDNLVLSNQRSYTFIATISNDGVATTVNGKSLYLQNTTLPPQIMVGDAVTIWYNTTNSCFYMKDNHSRVIPATLLSTGWVGTSAPYTQQVTVNGVTATNNCMLSISGATLAQYSAASDAQLMPSAQSANSITISAMDSKPTIDIPIAICILV